VIERWRKEYNYIRPHSSLGYRPPCTTGLAVIIHTAAGTNLTTGTNAGGTSATLDVKLLPFGKNGQLGWELRGRLAAERLAEGGA
jgi:hypothetical protein